MKKIIITGIVVLSLFAILVSAALTQYLFVNAETGVPGDHFSTLQGDVSYSTEYAISGSKSLRIQNVSVASGLAYTSTLVNGSPMVVELDFYDTNSSNTNFGNLEQFGVGGCAISDQDGVYYVVEGVPE